MSLLHVQQWLAHLTPEMTLVYAKLFDSTRRKEWEQAFAKGAVRIDSEGNPKIVNAEQLGNEQEIDWKHIRHNLDINEEVSRWSIMYNTPNIAELQSFM